MNPEERKEYNKNYYNDNKAVIQSKLSAKEECKFCNRCVAHQNLPKHWTSKLCQSRRIIMVLLNQNNTTKDTQ